MTVKISRQRRGDAGCVSSKSSTSICSPKHSNHADRSSVLKSPHVNPSRRQSPRLKVIKAVYKADDASYAKLQQQSSGDNQDFENPTLEQDHKSGNRHLENCGDEERIMDPNDLIIMDITLKDIQTRCKARKWKTLKTVASSASDLRSDHSFLKSKEEEPDLDEPLISLRSKLSNKSLTEKQQRCSHSSESFFPAEKTTAQPSTELEAHCSSSIETDKVSIKKELIGASISVSTDKNMGVISLKDHLHAGSSHLIYDIKSEIADNCLCDIQRIDDGAVSSTLVYYEIVENCLVDMQRKDDGAVSSTLVYDERCNVLDNSSAELLQNVSEGKSGNGDSCCFIRNGDSRCFIRDVHNPGVIDPIDMAICNSSHPLSVKGAKIQVDRSGSVYVQSETSEAETQVFENTISLSNSPTSGFIAKLSYSGNSSNQLVEKDGGISLSGGSTYLTTTSEPLSYPVYEDSSGLKVDNSTYLSECTQEHFGEIREESSHQSFLKLSPSLSGPKIPFSLADGSGLVTMVLSSDACDAIKNQTTPQEEIKDNATNGEKYSAAIDSQESMSVNYVGESNMNNKLSNQVDEATEKMQICSLQDSVTTEHNLLCGEKNDLKMVFYSKSDGDCLDNLILEAFAGDPLSKGNKDDNVSQAEECSSGVTYNVCPPSHSHTYFSALYDLHGVDKSSSKNEVYSSTLEQMVNGYREKASSPGLTDTSSSPGEPTETLVHSPPVSPPRRSEINDAHNVEDSLRKAKEHLLPSVAKEQLQPSAGVQNYPSTETPCSIYDRESMEKKIKCDQGVKVELHPKKLLSNRKDLSPTCKEMLLQALNGSDLYDTKQTFGHGEAEAMLSSSRMMKRKKSTHLLDYGEAEVLMRSNRMMKKTRSDTDVYLPPVTRGILRSPDKSESTLIHTQAQKAITFSQRQMQDVENIATKLLRELKSMQNIVEGSLSSDECPLAPPKYTPEEIRTATQSVSALEATTRKWLSMMAKDCNRFCKIMKSTENKVGTSVNGPRKQQKKITFADEAGGLLCHVKIFEQQSDSSEVPISEG